MVVGIFHEGSGLGNQLHRYVGTKILAIQKGEDHTMIAPELFKGKDFMNIPLTPNNIKYTIKYPSGEVIPESYEGVIDGEFQVESDFMEYLPQIREWLKVEPVEIPDDVVIISHRGGEYKGVPDLYLPDEYWYKAMSMFPGKKFEVQTDDVEEARRIFPDCKVTHDAGLNWRNIRYAKNLILSNSSFAILPAYLNENVNKVIAPKYWARYNTKEWINPDNATYSKFTYIHHEEMKKIFVSGTYDILHAGHVQFFKEARALGDFLVVSFCSDPNLMKYKGRHSCMPDDNKKVLLDSIRYVDKAVIGNDDGGIWDFVPAFLEEKPAVLAVTTDDKYIDVKRKFCVDNNAELVVLPKTLPEATPTTSYTIIKKIIEQGLV